MDRYLPSLTLALLSLASAASAYENADNWLLIDFRNELGQEVNYYSTKPSNEGTLPQELPLYVLERKNNDETRLPYFEAHKTPYSLKLGGNSSGHIGTIHREGCKFEIGARLFLFNGPWKTLGSVIWEASPEGTPRREMVGRTYRIVNPYREGSINVEVAIKSAQVLPASPLCNLVDDQHDITMSDYDMGVYYFTGKNGRVFATGFMGMTAQEEDLSNDGTAELKDKFNRWAYAHRRFVPLEVLLAKATKTEAARVFPDGYQGHPEIGLAALQGSNIAAIDNVLAARSGLRSFAEAKLAETSHLGDSEPFTSFELSMIRTSLSYGSDRDEKHVFESPAVDKWLKEAADDANDPHKLALFIKSWRGFVGYELKLYLAQSSKLLDRESAKGNLNLIKQLAGLSAFIRGAANGQMDDAGSAWMAEILPPTRVRVEPPGAPQTPVVAPRRPDPIPPTFRPRPAPVDPDEEMRRALGGSH